MTSCKNAPYTVLPGAFENNTLCENWMNVYTIPDSVLRRHEYTPACSNYREWHRNPSDSWQYTLKIGEAQLCSFTEIAPKSTLLCVNKKPIRYGFNAGAIAPRLSVERSAQIHQISRGFFTVLWPDQPTDVSFKISFKSWTWYCSYLSLFYLQGQNGSPVNFFISTFLVC